MRVSHHYLTGLVGGVSDARSTMGMRRSRVVRQLPRRIVAVALSLLLFVGYCDELAHADGGQVRVVQQQGDYKVTIFTSPNPLRAGPIDLSVLVQDANSGQAVKNASVIVEFTSPDDSRLPVRAAATTAAATNKLLQAALVELPAPGRWDVCVRYSVPNTDTDTNTLNEIRFAIEATPPLPRWLTVWPWFTWPMLAVLFFAYHCKLVADRTLIARRYNLKQAESAPRG